MKDSDSIIWPGIQDTSKTLLRINLIYDMMLGGGWLTGHFVSLAANKALSSCPLESIFAIISPIIQKAGKHSV